MFYALAFDHVKSKYVNLNPSHKNNGMGQFEYERFLCKKKKSTYFVFVGREFMYFTPKSAESLVGNGLLYTIGRYAELLMG